jgi:glycosyltransferase involved in cell wall biosynthesis
MINPRVTVGVPVYRGQETLQALLECLRTQSYKDIDVLISVDGADQASAEAAKPFLHQDPRFRMHVHPSRLGWAGNTDWTMRQCAGDFYIYQQHDDLVSPTYIADLVEASSRYPNSAICFSKLRFTGIKDKEIFVPSLIGDATTRALEYLRRLDWVPFRGLIRSTFLNKTSGLLLSDFDPFDSLGTEHRFMAELSLLGEFRFVEGPTYFKSWHGENLSKKRDGWPREHLISAVACFAAWMVEVITPIGASPNERWRLFKITLERFLGRTDLLGWIRPVLSNDSKALLPLRRLRDLLKRNEKIAAAVKKLGPSPLWQRYTNEERASLIGQIFKRLKTGRRFDPYESLNMSWEALELKLIRYRTGWLGA